MEKVRKQAIAELKKDFASALDGYVRYPPQIQQTQTPRLARYPAQNQG